MWTDTADGRSFIKNVSQSVVGEIAPGELGVFEDLIQEYFQDPTPPDLSAKASDDPLGFGLGGVLIALTPAAAAALKAVIDYLIGPTFKGIMEEGTTVIRNKIKAMMNPEPENKPEPAVPLGEQGEVEKETPPDSSKEGLVIIKKIARAEAKKFGLKDDEADKLAGVIVGKIALAKGTFKYSTI